MSKPDWEAIESAYRAGLMSVREIASQFSISHQAISKRAKKDGWDRDLKAKVKAKAENLVAKREVAKSVATEMAISERKLIEASAEIIANVRMEHRGDIRRARMLVNSLLDELEAECMDHAALHKLGELLRREDDKGIDKLNDLYRKIISMPGRVKSMKELTESLKNLIGLERQAYSIEGICDTENSEQQEKELLERRRMELVNKKLEAEIENLGNRGGDGAIVVHGGLDVPGGE